MSETATWFGMYELTWNWSVVAVVAAFGCVMAVVAMRWHRRNGDNPFFADMGFAFYLSVLIIAVWIEVVCWWGGV